MNAGAAFSHGFDATDTGDEELHRTLRDGCVLHNEHWSGSCERRGFSAQRQALGTVEKLSGLVDIIHLARTTFSSKNEN